MYVESAKFPKVTNDRVAAPNSTKFPKPFRVEPARFAIVVDTHPLDFEERLIAWCKRSWTWLASIAAHAIVVLILGLLTQHLERFEAPSTLTVNPGELETRPEPMLVSNLSVDSSLAGSTSAAIEVNVPIPSGGDIIGSLSPLEQQPVGTGSNNGVGSGPAAEVQAMLAAEGRGIVEKGRGSGQAEFFGIQASGDNFVFVVDSSRSMSGSKWRRACGELVRSVERLGPGKAYCVYFFDTEAHLMFNRKPSELTLVNATEENLRRLRRWMVSIDLGNSTRPLTSVKYALGMKPDAVFLLSDGEFQDETASYLRTANLIREEDRVRPETIIHTVCFKSMAGAPTLHMIAEEHGGNYRFVK